MKSQLPSLLADDIAQQLMGSGHTSSGLGLGQFAVFLGALVLVVLLVFIWAVFIRKPGRRKHRHHHDHHSGGSGAPGGGAVVAESGHRRKRRRRRHRPRNPSLAESGGLPPPREDWPPEHSA